ncbi:MAG: ATP-binding cassette domain-containing protein [Firmicutes bacterium]|nr:ATP-binding cassette domain-containing protein [Bacillota bacterium]
MLELKNITKIYQEEHPVTALDKLNLQFGDTGLVSILGHSGCGKTSLLNIIGGLDNYDGGNMTVDGISTAQFTEREFNYYRANSIGFIFQTGQSIPHLTAIENVRMPLKLLGIRAAEQTIRAKKILKQVGLQHHENRVASHLSVGERQRVELARALVKNPQIILADEPTGNLDDINAEGVMQILRTASHTRLVILVTHNRKLAEEYSDRIITMKHGRVESDREIKQTDLIPTDENVTRTGITQRVRRRPMGLRTMFGLAFASIAAKRVRTLATLFAVGLGAIALSLSLALGTGFSAHVDDMRTGYESGAPITIGATQTPGRLTVGQTAATATHVLPREFTDLMADPATGIDPYAFRAKRYNRAMEFNLLVNDDNGLAFTRGTALNFQEINSLPTVEQQYEMITGGRLPQNASEVLVVTNTPQTFTADRLGETMLWLPNNVYYVRSTHSATAGQFLPRFDELRGMNFGNAIAWRDGLWADRVTSTDTMLLTVVGVVRPRENGTLRILEPGIAHHRALTTSVVARNMTSEIVAAQQLAWEGGSTQSILTHTEMDFYEYRATLARLGFNDAAVSVEIFPVGLDGARTIADFVTRFNARPGVQNVYLYDPIAQVGDLVWGVTAVLMALAILALVIAVIMLGMIIWVTAQERAGEIAILRSLGASRGRVSALVNL